MLTRRTLLTASATIGAVTAVSGTWGAKQAMAQYRLRVRKTLEGMPLDAPDLETYREFVRMMQAKNQADRVSWLGYCLMHGDYRTGRYKYCPHGDWYFLPWHREFVCMYETAARKLTGNDGFAMPYWNWTNQRRLPDAFAARLYKGRPNPLYVANRRPLVGQYALTDSLVGPKLFALPGDPDYSAASVYSETDYELFGTSRNPRQNNLDMSWVVRGGGHQGTLESRPHNMVHNNIGAFMPTPGSPLDPIFMMHHSHIDGIWTRWNALGRQNSRQRLWLDMEFTENYLTPAGALYSKKVSDLLTTKACGYTYDSLPPSTESFPDPNRSRKLSTLFGSVAGAGPESLDLQRINARGGLVGSAVEPLRAIADISQPAAESFGPESAGDPTPEVFALIREITLGRGIDRVNVFVNHPDLQHFVSEEDPRFVTTFAFLRHEADPNKEKPSVVVNLTSTLRRLAAMGELEDNRITVQLLPVAEPGALLEQTEPVTVESIEIAVL